MKTQGIPPSPPEFEFDFFFPGASGRKMEFLPPKKLKKSKENSEGESREIKKLKQGSLNSFLSLFFTNKIRALNWFLSDF